jgi:hypothetical protein
VHTCVVMIVVAGDTARLATLTWKVVDGDVAPVAVGADVVAEVIFVVAGAC